MTLPFSYWSYGSMLVAWAIEIPFGGTVSLIACAAQLAFVVGLLIGRWGVRS